MKIFSKVEPITLTSARAYILSLSLRKLTPWNDCCAHSTRPNMPDRSGDLCRTQLFYTNTKQQKSKSQKNNTSNVSILLNSLARFVFKPQHTCLQARPRSYLILFNQL